MRLNSIFLKAGLIPASLIVIVSWPVSLAQADTYNVYTCTFPDFAEPLKFAFQKNNNTGLLIGNVGNSDVAIHFGNLAISFLEMLPTGAVQSTTIAFSDGAAVHSRHSLIFEKFANSQQSGQCELNKLP